MLKRSRRFQDSRTGLNVGEAYEVLKTVEFTHRDSLFYSYDIYASQADYDAGKERIGRVSREVKEEDMSAALLALENSLMTQVQLLMDAENGE